MNGSLKEGRALCQVTNWGPRDQLGLCTVPVRTAMQKPQKKAKTERGQQYCLLQTFLYIYFFFTIYYSFRFKTAHTCNLCTHAHMETVHVLAAGPGWAGALLPVAEGAGTVVAGTGPGVTGTGPTASPTMRQAVGILRNFKPFLQVCAAGMPGAGVGRVGTEHVGGRRGQGRGTMGQRCRGRNSGRRRCRRRG